MDVNSDTNPDPGTPRPSIGLVVAIGLLLAAPVVALMWVGSYNREEPRLGGIPFFYWYQFGWVFLCAITTSIAYRLVMVLDRRRRERAVAGTGDVEGRRS